MDRSDDQPTEALGHTIKVLRVDREISRRELAEWADISYSYLTEIENGDKPPSSSVLGRLAKALGLAPSELMAAAEIRSGRSEPSPAAPSGDYSGMMPSRRGKRAWFSKKQAAMREYPDLLEPLARMEADYESAATPAPEGRGAGSSRSQALSEVVALFDRLTDDDVERVLDLVRRLARR